MNDLKKANALYRSKKYEAALAIYENYETESVVLKDSIVFNIDKIKKLLGNTEKGYKENLSKADRDYLKKQYLEDDASLAKVIANVKIYLNNNKESWAKFLVNAALEFWGNEEKLLLLQAQCYFVTKDFVGAVGSCEKIIKNNEFCSDAYKIKEQALIELEEFEAANSVFLNMPISEFPKEAKKRGVNPCLPENFTLPPLVGVNNDYTHILEKVKSIDWSNFTYVKKVSIIITVYNRSQVLANTLAGIVQQSYPQSLIEVLVIDDGSNVDICEPTIRKYEKYLNIIYVRQKDEGYRLAKARNLGLSLCKGDGIIFMDADILPLSQDIEKYMRVLHIDTNCVLIGHRRYVDVSAINDDEILKSSEYAESLPSINPNNDVAGRVNDDGIAFDWRFETYNNTNFLKEDLWPFNKASGGNIAFSRELLERAGLVDEAFQAWGCEDGEHGYRLYNEGAYFIPMLDIICLHQEPVNEHGEEKFDDGESFRSKGHKITKQILESKCPAPYARKFIEGRLYEVPKVSIYIPVYNGEKYIVSAVESCLSQSYTDIEVVICNDGSTDNTLNLLKEKYTGHPRVHLFSKQNGGIGSATNYAISKCNGMYIAQLDADDRLKPNAVAECVQVLDYQNVDGVYTDCEYIDDRGEYVRDGWCGGQFDRMWMATSMIATHFRMFRRRIIARIPSVNEDIANAVDLDLWLKINERAHITHIHKKLYQYRWHGQNTSIAKRKLQEKNHVIVVNDSFRRLGLSDTWKITSAGNKLNPRELIVRESSTECEVNKLVVLIPSCKKYAYKADAIRKTWANKLSSLGASIWFLYGDPEASYAYTSSDCLFVPCRDDYESLLLKLTLGYEYVHKHFNFRFLLKIDDDCILNVPKFRSLLKEQAVCEQYLGMAVHKKGVKMNNKWHYGKCSTPDFDKPYKDNVAPVTYAKGGYSYILRKDALTPIIRKLGVFKSEIQDSVYSYEDVRVGEVLAEAGIFVRELDVKLNDAKSLNPDDRIEDSLLIFDVSDESCFYNISFENKMEKAQ
jgi:glycosyltransferase involved in cell wall biosynthesis